VSLSLGEGRWPTDWSDGLAAIAALLVPAVGGHAVCCLTIGSYATFEAVDCWWYLSSWNWSDWIWTWYLCYCSMLASHWILSTHAPTACCQLPFGLYDISLICQVADSLTWKINLPKSQFTDRLSYRQWSQLAINHGHLAEWMTQTSTTKNLAISLRCQRLNFTVHRQLDHSMSKWVGTSATWTATPFGWCVGACVVCMCLGTRRCSHWERRCCHIAPTSHVVIHQTSSSLR